MRPDTLGNTYLDTAKRLFLRFKQHQQLHATTRLLLPFRSAVVRNRLRRFTQWKSQCKNSDESFDIVKIPCATGDTYPRGQSLEGSTIINHTTERVDDDLEPEVYEDVSVSSATDPPAQEPQWHGDLPPLDSATEPLENSFSHSSLEAENPQLQESQAEIEAESQDLIPDEEELLEKRKLEELNRIEIEKEEENIRKLEQEKRDFEEKQKKLQEEQLEIEKKEEEKRRLEEEKRRLELLEEAKKAAELKEIEKKAAEMRLQAEKEQKFAEEREKMRKDAELRELERIKSEEMEKIRNEELENERKLAEKRELEEKILFEDLEKAENEQIKIEKPPKKSEIKFSPSHFSPEISEKYPIDSNFPYEILDFPSKITPSPDFMISPIPALHFPDAEGKKPTFSSVAERHEAISDPLEAELLDLYAGTPEEAVERDYVRDQGIHHRLYEEANRRRLLQGRYEKEKYIEDLKGCTFRPGGGRGTGGSDVHQRLYLRAEEGRVREQVNLRRKLEQELSGCTFTPALGSTTLSRNFSPLRLYEEAERKRATLRETQPIEIPSKPSTSRPVSSAIYEKLYNSSISQAARLRKQQLQREQMAAKDATFTPQVNSRRTESSGLPAYERLYLLNEEMLKRLESKRTMQRNEGGTGRKEGEEGRYEALYMDGAKRQKRQAALQAKVDFERGINFTPRTNLHATHPGS